MLLKERDSVLTFVGAQNLDDLGIVNYSTLQATFLHSIRKTDGTDLSKFENLDQYITFTYA